MKNFIALSLLFFVSLTLFGQRYQGVRDNRYRGVVIYEGTHFNGTRTILDPSDLGVIQTISHEIGSIKVYGGYQLKFVDLSGIALEDDPVANVGPNTRVVLERGTTQFVGILYENNNFGGRAWFIKEGQRLDRNVTLLFSGNSNRDHLRFGEMACFMEKESSMAKMDLSIFVEPQVVVVELVLQRRSAHHKWRESTVFQVL